MYLPPHFEENRPDELHQFISAHPLGSLVVNGPSGLDANHIPFLLDAPSDEPKRLLAHVARANPVWQDVPSGSQVLVIFRTNGAYISPNWYPSKHETHQQVPTWNYQAVHVHGTLTVHDDATFVRGVVARLTREHENHTNPASVWKMTDAPREFIDRMVAAIVGIEVRVDRIVGKWKIGQNRNERDRLSAADALSERGETETSTAMREAKRTHGR